VFDLLALLGTLHATACELPIERWRVIARFAAFFTGELWRTYVLQRPERNAQQRRQDTRSAT
jgi:hypothetical protein